MRRSRSKKTSPTMSVVLVLLLITTLAIGTGYFLSGFLISSFASRNPSSNQTGNVNVQPSTTPNTTQPTSSGNTSTPSTTADPSQSIPASTVKVTPTLPSILYGQVQLGAFAQESNAANLASSLREQGFPASVIKGDLHRVVVGIFAERSLADDYKRSLEAKGHKDILLSSREIHLTAAKTFQGSEADLVKALGTLVSDAAEIVNKLLQISDQLCDKSVDQAAWQRNVDALLESVTQLEQVQLPAVESPLTGGWTQLIRDLKTHLTNQRGRTLGDLSAWGSAQTELARVLSDMQTIYDLLSR